MVRRLLATLMIVMAAGVARAQSPYPPGPPPPVGALPDSPRQTTYSLSGSTCACAVGFQLYGDSTDFQNWLQVWVNGVQVQYNDPVYGWSISSPTGSLATIPRPITDAVLTFNSPQTGTVLIVGARRPRRTAQFAEGQPVATRDLNLALTDIEAQNREFWDKINDLTGRGLFFAPGTATATLPPASSCENALLGFDASGSKPVCVPQSGGGGGGGSSGNMVLINTSTTLTTAQLPATFECDASGGNVLIRLPAPAAGVGEATFLRTDSSANQCTVQVFNGSTMSGLGTLSLNTQNRSHLLRVDAAATAWDVIE